MELDIVESMKCERAWKQRHTQIVVRGLPALSLPKLITVFYYNTLIKSCPTQALRLYGRMRFCGVSPNAATFTLILRDLRSLNHGLLIHTHILKLGFSSSVFVANTLLNFYAKFTAGLDRAQRVFDEMPHRDVVSWNSMISFYIARRVESAITLFHSMPERNIVTWNSVVCGLCKSGNMELARSFFESAPARSELMWNSMITGYARTGDVDSARHMFNGMPDKTVVSWTAMVSGYTTIGNLESARDLFDKMPLKNAVSWNSMIAGYVHNHMFDQALGLFNKMLLDGRCRPDETTLVSVLSACSHLGSMEHGKWVDSYIKRNRIALSTRLGNALVDMFAKSGDVRNARVVFDSMAERCIVTWTTMVSGLGVNGKCRQALALFDEMCLKGEAEADDVMFIAVLSACTHGGLVEEGKRVFRQMVREFGIEPRIEHYGCVVDMLGRAGRLEEAVGFVESMHLKPNGIIWATLLGACKIHGNGELLETVTGMIMEQEPRIPSYVTLISKLSGRWNDESGYRAAMREKTPGCSSIQVGNEVHEFVARDTEHRDRKAIYQALRCLNVHLY